MESLTALYHNRPALATVRQGGVKVAGVARNGSQLWHFNVRPGPAIGCRTRSDALAGQIVPQFAPSRTMVRDFDMTLTREFRPRVKSNDNVTEVRSFYQMIMLPGHATSFHVNAAGQAVAVVGAVEMWATPSGSCPHLHSPILGIQGWGSAAGAIKVSITSSTVPGAAHGMQNNWSSMP